MNLPAALYAIRVLIADTFRQSLHSAVFWIMTALNAVVILFCLGIGFQGDEPILPPPAPGEPRLMLPADQVKDPAHAASEGIEVTDGSMTFAFGAIRVERRRPRDIEARYIQYMLVTVGADTIGVLLALIFTGGFVPTFLEPANASVLLAKPAPRWSLLAGKYLGVLTFLALQGIIFIGGSWLALGIATGQWSAYILASIPLLLIHFAVFFAASLYVAVSTRSTVAAVFGSLLFWLICMGINIGRNTSVAFPEAATGSAFSQLVEWCYWIMPKPMDLNFILYNAMRADGLPPPFSLPELTERGAFFPELSILTSLLAALALFALAVYEFRNTDY